MNGGFPVYIEYNEVERRSSKAETMLGTQHGAEMGLRQTGVGAFCCMAATWADHS